MSLAPCLRCGQALGDDEKVCAACGQVVGAPLPPPDPEPEPAPLPAESAPPTARKNGAIVFVGAAAAALACYAGWASLGPRAPLPPKPPTAKVAALVVNNLPAVSSAAMNAPSAAASAPHESVHPEDEEAELPPVPKHLNPKATTFYGVVYDLATKKPVKGARIVLGARIIAESPTYTTFAVTDAHGWYRQEIPFIAAPVNVQVVESLDPQSAASQGPRYISGALQEQDPPLASKSDVARHTIAEEAHYPVPPLKIPGFAAQLAELDLVLIPRTWPAGMPAADLSGLVVDPPIPDEPDETTCRYYGAVYDLATKKPLRHLSLVVSESGFQTTYTTDGLGHYTFDSRTANMGPLTITASAAGYRPGLVPERDPPMRGFSATRRRAIADTIDLAFDPADMDDGCDDGLVRFDLVAVPEHWPGR